jgi:hypothetical protein
LAYRRIGGKERLSEMAKKLDIKALIDEAVNAGLNAGRAQASSTAKDAFKATERRLFAIPILERKVKDDKEKLAELQENGSRWQSKSITRFQRTGYRVTPEEMLEAIIQDLEATIAADEYEINTIRGILETFKDDPFYMAVTGRYVDREEDEDIAAKLDCSANQVWKQRTRIVSDIAVMLYGSDAV